MSDVISTGGSGASVSGHPNWNRDDRGEPKLNIALTSIKAVSGTPAVTARILLQDQSYFSGSVTLSSQGLLSAKFRTALSMTEAQWADISWMSIVSDGALYYGQTEATLTATDFLLPANTTLELP